METTQTSVGQDELSIELQGRFETWLRARKPQEDKFLEFYADAMRIPRDDDTQGSGVSRAQKAKLFVGSTRSKIRSARAKIKDSLFGSGKMPFDTMPSNEKLKRYADTVEDILLFQLKDMGFKRIIGSGVDSLCTYGTGMLFGPFEREKDHVVVGTEDGPSGIPMIVEKRTSYRMPYFEHAPTMDVYPDPEAPDENAGRGVFWSSWKAPHEVKSWARQPGYNAEAIAYACTQLSNNSSSEGSDLTTDERANLYRFSRDGRVRVVRYFGLVNAAALEAWMADNEQPVDVPEGAPGLAGLAEGADNAKPVDDGSQVEAIVILAGGVVIKADRNPYRCEKRPALRAVYEEVSHEFWGVGVAENNDPNQKVINAAFRLYVEGKAFALMKSFSADASMFELDENFKMYPGKRWKLKKGLTPEERKTAMIWHDTIDVTQGWENVIAMSERFSDDDTGITKYSQGNDASHLNNTATGISMIMSASSLPMKEVIGNVDEMWIERAVESLIEWNIQNLEPETVAVLLGPEVAQVWAEIQRYGKTNFMKWKATGSATFMMKEILMQKLQGFLQMVLSSPDLAQKVDIRELLEQVWDAGEIGKESPVFDEETLKQRQEQAGPQIPPEIQDVLQRQEQDIQRLSDRREQEQWRHDVAMAQIESNERIRMAELAIKDRDSVVGAEKTLSEVDLNETKIIQNLEATTVPPGAEQVQDARTTEGGEDGQ